MNTYGTKDAEELSRVAGCCYWDLEHGDKMAAVLRLEEVQRDSYTKAIEDAAELIRKEGAKSIRRPMAEYAEAILKLKP